MVKESDIPVFNKLISTLENAVNQLEKSYSEKNSGKFNEAKKIIIQTQRKILSSLEGK